MKVLSVLIAALALLVPSQASAAIFTLPNDLNIVEGNPRVAYIGTEAGGQYVETVEISGAVWTAQNATYTGVWTQVNPLKASYAFVQTALGQFQTYNAPAGSGAGFTWVSTSPFASLTASQLTSTTVSQGTFGGTAAYKFSNALTVNGGLTLGTPLAIANGGTGSATQNFVDLTTSQNVGGAKVHTAPLQATSSNGTTPAYLPPTYTQSGAATASTLHAVEFSGTVTGTGSSTNAVFILSGSAAFSSTSSYSVSASEVAGSSGLTYLVVNLSATQIQVFFTGTNTIVYTLIFYAVGT